MGVDTTAATSSIYLLADHLDAALAAGEDMLALRLGQTPAGDRGSSPALPWPPWWVC